MIQQILNPNNYYPNGYSFPMFVVAAAITLAGLVILVRENGSTIGRSFLFMCLSVGLYLIATAANYASRNESLSLLWIRISQLGSVFIPATVLLLSADRSSLNHRHRCIIATSFVLSTLFALGALFTNLHVKGSAPFFWGRFAQYGPLGFVFMGYFFGIMVFVLRRYLLEYRHSSTDRQKKRLRGRLIAFSGAYLGSVDFLPTFGISVYPFGYLPLGVFIVVISYFISRDRFADITPEMATGQILDTMQGAVIVADTDGRIRVINSVALEMLGYPRSELLGKELTAVLPMSSEMSAAAHEGGRILSREMTWQGRTRRYIVNMSASLLTTTQNGEPIGIVYVAYDITDRKRAEEALRRSEEENRALISALPDMTFRIERNGMIKDYRCSDTSKLYAPPELFLGKKLRDVLPAHVADAAMEKMNGVFATGKMSSFECALQIRGQSKFFDDRIVRLGNEEVLHVIRDITECRQVEEALHERDERLRQAVRVSQIGIFDHDQRTDTIYWSSQQRIIHGWGPDEPITLQMFLDRIHPEDLESVAASVRRAHDPAGDGIWEVEHRIVRRDGTIRWLKERSQTFFEGEGDARRPVRTIGAVLDITERKQAEEAILYFQMAVSSSIDAIGMSTPAGRHYYQNEAYTKLFGLSVSEVDGASGPPATVYADEKVGRKVFDIIMKGGSFVGEVKMLDRDRKERDIYLRAYSIKNKEGKVVGLVGLHNDVTEQRQAEQKLRKSESQLRQSQLVAKLGNWDLNLVSKEFEWSDETYRLFDKSPSDFVPSLNEFTRRVHPDDLETMQTDFENALKSDAKPYHVAVRMINDSGREWVMEAFGVVRRDASGTALSIFGTAQDITERKQAEEKIRRSEEFIRSILDTVDEEIIVLDRDYRILTANKAYRDKVGGSDEKIIGQHCYEISHKINRPCYEDGDECTTRRAFDTGEPHSVFHRHTDANGNILYVETKAFPLKDASGGVISVIETIHDMTEKHLLEEERLKTQKLESIGTLAGGIAHDFNNLLQGIFGYISMAKMTVDQKEKTVAMLEQAEKALHQSVNFTTQLLTFSKGGRPVRKLTDLGPVIKNSAQFVLSGSQSDIRINIPKELWQAEVDEGQLGQVIQNIVLNADQAMPVGGTVIVTAANVAEGDASLLPGLGKGNYVMIAIQDTGIGIHKRHLSKIFDPYFTTKDKGSGLGLATSYSIVRNHGGVIDVRTKWGEGSTFMIYLPAITGEARAETTVGPAKRALSRTARVLVMDDEEIIRNMSRELLVALGHNVEVAKHGQEALEKYQHAMTTRNPYDIVILDLTIRGGIGGLETMQKLLGIDPDVTAIVSSGYSDDATASNFEKQGFKAFLKKPYDVVNLKEVLDNVLSS
ncbi:MAG TPA: PAS domain S-box protein [Nitrospirota bacterium]|nr:PAS domain S-box protein [Nitrospirota bacterium]